MTCIEAEERSECSSFSSCNYRKQGKTPANFYGKGMKNIPLLVDSAEIVKLQPKKSCAVISLKIEEKKYDILIQDIQCHPVTMKPIHVDFLAIDPKKKVKVSIPVRYLNVDKCIGIKQGGYLNKIYRRIPLLCLPSAIPEFIEIDTSDFSMGKVIKIKDLGLPEDLKPLRTEDVVVCNVIGRVSKQQDEKESVTSSEQGK